MILELGLRYRPANAEALEGHNAKLAALASDVADIPPQFLEQAIKRWVVESPYLPKASDLVALAKKFATGVGLGAKVDLCARYNARLKGEGKFHIHWVEDVNGDMKLEPVV